MVGLRRRSMTSTLRRTDPVGTAGYLMLANRNGLIRQHPHTVICHLRITNDVTTPHFPPGVRFRSYKTLSTWSLGPYLPSASLYNYGRLSRIQDQPKNGVQEVSPNTQAV